MREPRFWQQSRPGEHTQLPARLLAPAGYLYGVVSRWKQRLTKAARAPVPVICIGNITVGGAGKTPVAIHIAEYFISQDYLVHFLTRGYGGREKGPLLVDPKIHTAADVGDEPLL